MAIGNYGTIRPSDVNIEDIQVLYRFQPNRETEPSEFIEIDSTSVLSETLLPEDLQTDGEDNLLEGMYNLTLPATVFSELGIYTLFLRPRINRLQITDCGVLSADPTVKGIVLNVNDLDENLRANNALQGFKIEYINSDGTKLRNVVRYVTTSNKVIPINENVGNTSAKSVRYRFDDAGSLMFLTLTPSSASSVKPNAIPFIGVAGQNILLSNTQFNSQMIEVEMVENDIDSVIDYVAGEQIKDVDNGILTVYDKNREIVRQYNLYEIKDSVGNVPLYEVKEKRENIDTSQDFNDVTDDVQ